MLHLRSRSRFPDALTTLRDLLATNDQGLLRLQMALRGTGTVVLATAAALIAAKVGGFSAVDCASGITFSMMAPFLMREPTQVQRQRTLLMLVLPAIGASVITTLLHGQEVAGDAAFLLMVFLCFLLAPRSRGWSGSGSSPSSPPMSGSTSNCRSRRCRSKSRR